MFLTHSKAEARQGKAELAGRNPLKSGQCFLRGASCYKIRVYEAKHVAIPSNRVNVSYLLTLFNELYLL